MEYRKLGSSDLVVSEISLGSWLTYGGGVAREQAQACVQAAFDAGINFIDTANVYSGGRAEELLGEALRGMPRDRYVLATKLYFPMSQHDRGLSAAQVRKQLDGSLRRLRLDHVDLYQCHRYDPETPLEETMEALTEAVRQGKTRYVGFSEWSPDQIRAALALPGERFVSSQPQYSILWRAPEAEVFPVCQAAGIGQIVWSPLAQGILTGKYRPGAAPPPGSRATSESMGVFIQKRLDDRVLAGVQALRPIAAELGITLSQLALAWVLRRPEVASAIIGASRPEQVVENAQASGVKLSADVLRRIDAAFDGPVSHYP
ncbi:aldo/keto reductase family protein [Anaeromyxobacter sp. Fw109-5]|uniref:aldo/keto reductase family protein n=1 Tax=Anaeromyxobacter sp. (strain Fw109-5) TaxID=404589 RepID=UPI0000ED7626|nr:aldo/keto reductase family protein [Anaeromyxobacter sp. Fw109-5]ABS25885.1 aldo/keto reductase [Anaeromyxobacter sp. Fw109-5]